MPERTNPKQRMIAIIREHLAEPGVTVTESKKLYDRASGTIREVDVVAEGTVNGVAITVSVEVIDHGRPASLTWVDQMLGKHLTMPTNKLLLVSWSGFSKAALRKVNAVPGVEVVAITPTPVLHPDGRPRHSEPLYVERISFAAEQVTVTVLGPDGTSKTVAAYRNSVTYDKDGAEQEPMGKIVTDILRSEAIGRRFSIDAHTREDREDLTGFSLSLPDLDRHVQRYVTLVDDPTELLLITAMDIAGKVDWEPTELKFAVVDVDGRAHGITQGPWFGTDVIWVATPKNDGTDEVQVTWRTMEPQPEPESSWAAQPPQDQVAAEKG